MKIIAKRKKKNTQHPATMMTQIFINILTFNLYSNELMIFELCWGYGKIKTLLTFQVKIKNLAVLGIPRKTFKAIHTFPICVYPTAIKQVLSLLHENLIKTNPQTRHVPIRAPSGQSQIKLAIWHAHYYPSKFDPALRNCDHITWQVSCIKGGLGWL